MGNWNWDRRLSILEVHIGTNAAYYLAWHFYASGLDVRLAFPYKPSKPGDVPAETGVGLLRIRDPSERLQFSRIALRG
jgi:hypothetical protein